MENEIKFVVWSIETGSAGFMSEKIAFDLFQKLDVHSKIFSVDSNGNMKLIDEKKGCDK